MNAAAKSGEIGPECMSHAAYVICATPRSGSTLLCDLLAATGVAGQPHSYFRSQDIEYWAALWGLNGPSAISDVEFNRAYVEAMKRAGSRETGIFGLRLMWQSLSEAAERLDLAVGRKADFATQLQHVFGPTLFVHLSRQNKEAQAVSLVRAKQTGLWHVAADGSERERTAPPKKPIFDAIEIKQTCNMLVSDDASWSLFFEQRAIEPVQIVYEDLAAEPQATLAGLLDALGRDRTIAERVSPITAKMADAESLVWTQQMKVERSRLPSR